MGFHPSRGGFPATPESCLPWSHTGLVLPSRPLASYPAGPAVHEGILVQPGTTGKLTEGRFPPDPASADGCPPQKKSMKRWCPAQSTGYVPSVLRSAVFLTDGTLTRRRKKPAIAWRWFRKTTPLCEACNFLVTNHNPGTYPPGVQDKKRGRKRGSVSVRPTGGTLPVAVPVGKQGR
jgi:hypothetical protein